MYAFEFQGKTFTPDGKVDIPDTQAHNAEVEANDLAWLQTHPDNLFLYVKHPTKQFDGPGNVIPATADCWWKVTTWPGTVVCEHAHVGQRRNMGFGYHSYRRAISATIFGVLYHGWYFESSGSYCRLRKAKVQPKPKTVK